MDAQSFDESVILQVGWGANELLSLHMHDDAEEQAHLKWELNKLRSITTYFTLDLMYGTISFTTNLYEKYKTNDSKLPNRSNSPMLIWHHHTAFHCESRVAGSRNRKGPHCRRMDQPATAEIRNCNRVLPKERVSLSLSPSLLEISNALGVNSRFLKLLSSLPTVANNMFWLEGGQLEVPCGRYRNAVFLVFATLQFDWWSFPLVLVSAEVNLLVCLNLEPCSVWRRPWGFQLWNRILHYWGGGVPRNAAFTPYYRSIYCVRVTPAPKECGPRP